MVPFVQAFIEKHPQLHNPAALSVVRRALADFLCAGACAVFDDPQRDADALIAHVTGHTRTDFMVRPDTVLPVACLQTLQQYGAARRAGKPVSRIIGQRGFWTLNIQLNADTLDPRPDTEILVETALQRWGAAQAGSPKAAPPASVLDLGTGSGCILLALLSEWAGAMGIGVDISAAALAMAQRNAHVNNITTAHFVAGYWLDAVSSACMFDVVVSNPPYIPWSDADMLQPEVRCHDPERALFADENGLAVYRLLVPQVLPRLAPGGVFAVEVGIHQAAAVADMMRGAGYSSVQITQDYSGIDRVVSACAAH